jgi:hypothetical protein
MGAGAIVNLHIPYRDPTGGAPKACGMDMVAPLGYDDDPVNYTFRMSVNDDDTGGDLSATLTVAPTYGLEAVDYVLTNAGAVGYVTCLKAIGRGIYIYDPVENVAMDTTSRDIFGYKSDTIDMKYQDDVNTAASVCALFLARNKAPREIPIAITFMANINTTLMLAFLTIDMGDLIRVTETQTGIDGYCYVQKVEFTIKPPLIYFTWSLKEALSMSEFYWLLEDATYGLLDSTTVLGY